VTWLLLFALAAGKKLKKNVKNKKNKNSVSQVVTWLLKHALAQVVYVSA
jgi:hypothetical protein